MAGREPYYGSGLASRPSESTPPGRFDLIKFGSGLDSKAFKITSSTVARDEKGGGPWQCSTPDDCMEKTSDTRIEELETTGQSQERQERSVAASIYRVWLWEILSTLLSIGSLIAIVAILASRDGRPMPEWPRLVTVNSLISFFTVIFKASLLMPIAEGKNCRS